jgi:cleavage and polyadenylation specificity factor subunit 3
LAVTSAEDGQNVSGVIVRRNFNYHLIDPQELSGRIIFSFCLLNFRFVFAAYTELSHSTLTQRQSIFYSGEIELLQYLLQQVAGDVQIASVSDTDVDGKHKMKTVCLFYFSNVFMLHCRH